MKTFKCVDWIVQLGLIIGFAICAAVQNDMEMVLWGYVVVGGWQVVSMLVHVATGQVTRRTVRWYYNWVTLITIALIPTFVILYVLLFAAPVMALFYMLMCLHEWQKYPAQNEALTESMYPTTLH